MQLDKAASAIGKSEITLRRLVKANKIPFQKEKTPTGFIYLVDLDQVRAYYQAREGFVSAAVESPESSERANVPADSFTNHGTAVRVAVAGDMGGAAEYWQKRSELYEDRFHGEVMKHAQTREELGMWRGRAEQAQAMLVKLLPGAQTESVRELSRGEVVPTSKENKPRPSNNAGNGILVFVLSIVGVLVVGVVILLFILGKL
jgi:hypothetical protein